MPRLLFSVEHSRPQVSWRVYGAYLKAAGVLPFSLAMICFAGFRAFSVVANFLLSQWTEDPLLNNHSAWGSQVFVDTNHSYLLYYGLTGAAQRKYKFYCSVFASGDLRNVTFDMFVYLFTSQTLLRDDTGTNK